VGYFICYGCVNTASSFSWRFPFAFQATVSFLFSFACATLLPHSPSWLDVVGRKDEVDKTWETLGVSRAEIEKDEEMLERIVSNAPAAQTSKQVSWLGVFGRRVWKRTALGAFLMGMQQMSGIDGVLFVCSVYVWAYIEKLTPNSTLHFSFNKPVSAARKPRFSHQASPRYSCSSPRSRLLFTPTDGAGVPRPSSADLASPLACSLSARYTLRTACMAITELAAGS